MPPFHNRSAGALSIAWIRAFGVMPIIFHTEHRLHLGRERDRLRRARMDTPALPRSAADHNPTSLNVAV